MNRPIRTLAIGCLVLFLALLANITYIQAFHADALNDQSTNKRARDAECARKRGPILVNGQPIAMSVPSHDRLQYRRKYTDPKMDAPATGFYSCYFGASGVEKSQNSILSGSDERLFVNRIIDLVGNNEPQGGSVSLTLNPRAQKAAWEGLQDIPGDTSGAVVALNPKTGAILAMVSTPSYDPNRLTVHDFSRAKDAWKDLSAHQGREMLNLATQQRFPPGSTFKLVTASAALSEGYTPQSLVKGGASLDLPKTTHDLHNENGSTCGGDPITLTHALEVSCNVSFANLGLKLGKKTLLKQAEKYGFNQDYFDAVSTAESHFPTKMTEPETALAAIGQFDVAATPLQMAMVAAGIANDGAVMKPYLISEVRSPDLDVLDRAEPQVLHQAVSAGVATDLTQMMVNVVEEGTGTPARIPGVPVAGKTGTANTAPTKAPYAWMVTFAPADDPQVAVAVVITHTETPRSDITGGGLAGPIARDVMEAVIQR